MNGLQYALDLIDRSFSSGISRARNETRGLDDAVNNTNRRIGRLRNTGQSTFSNLAGYAKTAGICIRAALSVGAIINFGKEITAITSKFEGMENAIVFASGQEGAQNIAFLDTTIKDLNLNMESSYKGFQTLAGSLKGTALEGQGTRDIFEAVGIAASVMNLSAEQSEGGISGSFANGFQRESICRGASGTAGRKDSRSARDCIPRYGNDAGTV